MILNSEMISQSLSLSLSVRAKGSNIIRKKKKKKTVYTEKTLWFSHPIIGGLSLPLGLIDQSAAGPRRKAAKV